MKKSIYMCLAACLLVSCSQEEEAVYGKGNSYAKRTGETSTEYVNLLEGATNGWLLSMYVGTGQQYGGYNYIRNRPIGGSHRGRYFPLYP